mmetsp:Transcript_35539/g.86146  ORF Transcript_35539/g.86146 Transcript_35539/m.86146 type:complete len:296 (+) Transcript_35539:113-1000(+)|eukprot:CAMPEP_0113628334 /NCGR_PEP_ID=MMETSP0017_2-20120614/14680_1 /TAXON_ID=2856 /ORGANISM="Cylindrotheca closterium" /LENGTH=295 /DNA_ID=CAMNT_0000538633 /DNA_START=66 /DNA_END=953 /DNA_ORIENTATION=- /assembly_acc=CAM_ASM_000147
MVALLPLLHTLFLMQSWKRKATGMSGGIQQERWGMPTINATPQDTNLFSLRSKAAAATAAAFIVMASSAFPVSAATGKVVEGPSNAEMLEITLSPGEAILSEKSSLLYATDGIDVFRSLRGGSKLNRIFLGAKIAMDACVNEGTGPATIGLATHFPSRVIPVKLQDYGGTILGNQDSFLAAPSNVDLNFELEAVNGKLLGGFQRIERMTGVGTVYLTGSGNIIQKDLGPNESLRIYSGAWVAMTDDMKLQYVKKRDAFFSSYLLKVEGPGTVWIDTAPISRIVNDLDHRLPRHSD